MILGWSAIQQLFLPHSFSTMPNLTYFKLLLIFLLEWPLFASSAPTSPAGPSSKSSQTVDSWFRQYFIVDLTCNTRRGEIEKGFSDIFVLAEVTQHISEDSVPYQHYFLSRKQDPHELDIVRNMAKSILVNGNSNKKIIIKCPITGVKGIARTPFREMDSPEMSLSSLYFKFPTFSSRPFTNAGWCTPPPHNLNQFTSQGQIGYHEITHFEHIVKYALELSAVTADARVLTNKRGTFDFFMTKTNRATPLTASQSVRILLIQWEEYLSGKIKNISKPGYYPDEVAQSHALAAAETFFHQKCQPHGWDPIQVFPPEPQDVQSDLKYDYYGKKTNSG
ncbi:hypothetical protein C8J55DRAFT_528424 [Lentinula edodes]|uniref:Lysine-specific metallo-endopeptidase domain-containing protein n=1 Tax=Lentinula lateritia TaxID=40482 RepID=A0A9W8ZSE3_9AGAR|nr:hypothetical protein C8J55DRAFT_528424 [Lentinula edodes]